MNLVNRTALVVIPKRPYVDWANGLDDSGPKLTLDDPRVENTVYLIGEMRDNASVAKALKRHYPTIFEHELDAWHRDPAAWPQNRDFRTFKKWFRVDAHSVVVDLCDRGIDLEPFRL